MTFLAAPLLFGLALAGIPVVIHLLNRRRFIVVDWAPMKYLKLTIRTNRRRIQIEQWILLALRTLLIVLLVGIVARPALSKSGLGAWLARRARVSRVIVIDNSLPTGYRQGEASALDRAKHAVEEILRATGSKDAVTILTTAPAAPPVAREATVDDPAKLVAAVQALRPTAAVANWANTFKQVDDCLSTATFPQREVILVTDMRKAGWVYGGKSGGGNAVTDYADRWAAHDTDARVVDVGSRETADVAILRFAADAPVALPNTPVPLTAAVRNDTAVALHGHQATLAVDGLSRPVLLPDLPPGGTVQVPLSVVFPVAGPHLLKLSLTDPDALAGDDARTAVVDVREHVDLTIVDGRPGPGPFESAGDYLNVAFSVGQEPLRVRHVTDADVARPQPADVTAIVDAANLTPDTIADYERLVRDGMGLMIFAGEQVEPAAYNEKLYKNGTGLLPVRLDRVVDGPVRGLVVERFDDSPLTLLAKIAAPELAKVECKRVLGTDAAGTLPDGVRVLARWNDAEAHPAVVEKRFGRGRVVLWTTSADREWTDWPVQNSWVYSVREMAKSIARGDVGDDNVTAGRPIAYRPDDEARSPHVTTPDDATAQPATLDGGVIGFAHTDVAGLYTAAWTDAAGREQKHPVAVSFDRAAADLDPIADADLTKLLGDLRPQVVPYRQGQLAGNGSGREIWRPIAMTLLALMVVETAFAFWVGRER